VPTSPISELPWWKLAVFYQIYPLSFMDSNGDGLGDLAGVRSKLGYLRDVLGVDAIWLSPFYRSPMRDWGYDVIDHCDVDPIFGTLGEADNLIAEAHRRDLKVVVDYIINHTSDLHPWFLESRVSKASPKRDWYVWRPNHDDAPPNNWQSVFGGPAWELDPVTGEWYRHTYLKEQPDLNWRNPDVVEAMLDVARFWLDRGVDGFRVDAAHQMMKDPEDRDNPPTPPDYVRPWKDMGGYDDHIHLYDLGHPDVHDAHRQIRQVIDSYGRDAVSIGEIHVFDLPEWASYYGADLDEFHMPFNFHLMAASWDPQSIRAAIESVLWNLPEGAWTNWTLGNHDEIRLASRLPEGHHRMAAVLLLTLPGTPFLYYGDELGMREAEIPDDQSRDPWGENVAWLSRDGCRTPMLWSRTANAGFSAEGVEPWLPVVDVMDGGVDGQLGDPSSTLEMYRLLLDLRRKSPALLEGVYESSDVSSEHVLAYRRVHPEGSMLVALNFSGLRRRVATGAGVLRFSTHEKESAIDEFIELEPGEAVVIEEVGPARPTLSR
jgi:alpha-glucosidase